jgi:hypothetical protein
LDQRKGGNHAKLSAVQIELICELLHTYTPAQLFALDECVGDGEYWTVPDLAGNQTLKSVTRFGNKAR